MGHHFESLSLPAHLVAWHEAGLELVCKDLLPVAEPVRPLAADALAEGVDGETCEAGATESRQLAVMRPVSAARQSDAAPFRPLSAGGREQPPGSVPTSGASTPFHASVRAASGLPGSGDAAQAAQGPCVWTGPFQYARERLNLPLRAVWTYWELAFDFGGDPDSSRRLLWASIIKNLSYKQQVGFWPLSEQQGGTVLARPALFWQGVREFGATHVLCFGRRACMTLFPDRPFTPGVFQHDSQTAVILPGPEDMLPDNRREKGVAWNLLKDLRV